MVDANFINELIAKVNEYNEELETELDEYNNSEDKLLYDSLDTIINEIEEFLKNNTASIEDIVEKINEINKLINNYKQNNNNKNLLSEEDARNFDMLVKMINFDSKRYTSSSNIKNILKQKIEKINKEFIIKIYKTIQNNIRKQYLEEIKEKMTKNQRCIDILAKVKNNEVIPPEEFNEILELSILEPNELRLLTEYITKIMISKVNEKDTPQIKENKEEMITKRQKLGKIITNTGVLNSLQDSQLTILITLKEKYIEEYYSILYNDEYKEAKKAFDIISNIIKELNNISDAMVDFNKIASRINSIPFNLRILDGEIEKYNIAKERESAEAKKLARKPKHTLDPVDDVEFRIKNEFEENKNEYKNLTEISPLAKIIIPYYISILDKTTDIETFKIKYETLKKLVDIIKTYEEKINYCNNLIETNETAKLVLKDYVNNLKENYNTILELDRENDEYIEYYSEELIKAYEDLEHAITICGFAKKETTSETNDFFKELELDENCHIIFAEDSSLPENISCIEKDLSTNNSFKSLTKEEILNIIKNKIRVLFSSIDEFTQEQLVLGTTNNKKINYTQSNKIIIFYRKMHLSNGKKLLIIYGIGTVKDNYPSIVDKRNISDNIIEMYQKEEETLEEFKNKQMAKLTHLLAWFSNETNQNAKGSQRH